MINVDLPMLVSRSDEARIASGANQKAKSASPQQRLLEQAVKAGNLPALGNGDHTPPACRFRRPAETPSSTTPVRAEVDQYKQNLGCQKSVMVKESGGPPDSARGPRAVPVRWRSGVEKILPKLFIQFKPVRRARLVATAMLLFLFPTVSSFAAVWFVAPNGLDANTGTSNRPFATLMKAQSAASYGDTVYLRGGTYYLDNSNFTATNNPWAIVNDITKSGISYLAYPGERPVFNFSNVKPVGYRVTAFLIKANHCVFKGFDVVGVQVTIQAVHTQSECFRVDGGSNNQFIQLRMHDGMANGWYLTSGASNLVLDCDAYNNKGLDSGSIGNTDGFGCHPNHSWMTGNVLRGCRAWFNSDDGFDCINAFAPVTFSHCWAFFNGYWTNFTNPGGDGNGFKAGGYGANGSRLPNPVPRHMVEFCLAVHNRANGFYANHHAGGDDWFNNTAYANSKDYNLLCVSNDNRTSIPGFDQVMKNNLGYGGQTEVANLGSSNDVSYNFFSLPVTVSAKSFVSLDESWLTAPRQSDGSLPRIPFARLTRTSDCVDAGTNEGFPFYGAAPDLGAFEVGPTNVPLPAVARTGTNLLITASGWANRTNYLVATGDLSLPPAQWTCVATNESDLSGNCVFTNAISFNQPRMFYRLRQER